MKFTRHILAAAMVALAFLVSLFVAPLAHGQAFDAYSPMRPVVLTSPAVLTAANATVTNGPIDTSGFLGTAAIDVFSLTNAGGALTFTLEHSDDQTNWSALPNFALINS